MLELVGHPVAVNPDSALGRDRPRARLAGDPLRQAARRLKIGAALAAVGLVGGGGGYVAARLRPRLVRALPVR